MFLNDLNEFIRKNLKKNGYLVFGFPNYRKGASEIEISRQRKFTESLMGHSHPPEETILRANVAVFKIKNPGELMN